MRFSYSFPALSRRFLADPAIEVLLERVPGLALEIAQAVSPARVRELGDHLRHRRSIREAMGARGCSREQTL